MTEHTTIDITSPAFGMRLANLLVSTRLQRGKGRLAMARASQGRFGYRDLRDFERGSRALDEHTIDDLAQLYRCDLGTILPRHLPVSVTCHEVSAGGVHQGYVPDGPDAVLRAYLQLVHSLRHERRTPVVDLRRDDLEVLAGHLDQPRESVLHRLATLMNATQHKRAVMLGMLATGAAVIGLAGTATAVDSAVTPGNDGGSPTSVGVAPALVAATPSVGTRVDARARSATTVGGASPSRVVGAGLAEATDATLELLEMNLPIEETTTVVVAVGEPPVPSFTP